MRKRNHLWVIAIAISSSSLSLHAAGPAAAPSKSCAGKIKPEK